jgi:hypothetical protein
VTTPVLANEISIHVSAPEVVATDEEIWTVMYAAYWDGASQRCIPGPRRPAEYANHADAAMQQAEKRITVNILPGCCMVNVVLATPLNMEHGSCTMHESTGRFT